MRYRNFSERQKLAMSWWRKPGFSGREGIICDGSIRSGKTLCMSVGFVLWAVSGFSGQNFAFCGRTIEALRRNVIRNLPSALAGIVDIRERRGENLVIISSGGAENYFYLFGGSDESSAALIQGITLAGVLFDEAALMPRSFVEQAEGRCSVSGSKIWYNCNPEGPMHWFYTERVLKAREKGFLYLHFTMDDNPSLDPKIRQRYERLYTGIFYQRYILGRWCVAEGIIYGGFDFEKHTVGPEEIPKRGEHYISVDYGTMNPFSAGLWRVSPDGTAYRIAEFYYDGRGRGVQLTDEEYYAELLKLAGELPLRAVIVDPAAASFITCIRRHGRFPVRRARNEVSDGIRYTAGYLQSGKLKISRDCADAIREFRLYRWDESAAARSDRPLKENDHAMDEIRYFCMTILRRQ